MVGLCRWGLNPWGSNRLSPFDIEFYFYFSFGADNKNILRFCIYVAVKEDDKKGVGRTWCSGSLVISTWISTLYNWVWNQLRGQINLLSKICLLSSWVRLKKARTSNPLMAAMSLAVASSNRSSGMIETIGAGVNVVQFVTWITHTANTSLSW